MKTKIATALSLVGVLSAGSAAALVNTTILDNGPAKSGQSAAVPEQVASTSASSSSTIANTLPASTAASTTPSTLVVTVLAASTVPTGFLTAFNVGDAGAVTVDVIDGVLTIVSSTPNAGWQIVKSEQKIEDNKVEVYFQAATVQVEFEASFVNGQIVPEVSSSAPNGTVAGGTVPSNTTGNTIDDDDDDDETDNTIVDDNDGDPRGGDDDGDPRGGDDDGGPRGGDDDGGPRGGDDDGGPRGGDDRDDD